MPLLRALAIAAPVLFAACATKVARTDSAPEEPVAGMPWTPGTEAAIREWISAHANQRDLSVDLSGATPYVETALADGSDIPRVGFFFRRDPWRVGAVLYWLTPVSRAPEVGEPAGALWGMPLFHTARANELYAPAGRALLRIVDEAFQPPKEPQVTLPDDIRIKTPTRTFHRDHLYALVDGRIWFKRNPSREGLPGEPWRLFGEGLPAPRAPNVPFDRPSRIAAISADGDDLLAVDSGGRIYLCTTKSQSVSSENGWEDGWGFPGKRPLHVTGRAADPRALAIGRRAEHALWFEDPIGNRHHFGPMGTTTLYLLHHEGAEILFTDNGLPNDFSRALCAPDDGRFIAENLSASASAMFLIDRHGRMVTRFDDYDLNGGTPNFEYTYRSEVRASEQGDAFLTSMSPYYLPLLPWRWQPPPQLSGQARLSRDITILQTGAGNSARELRVAGLDESGTTGYYRKGIDEEGWLFVASPHVELDPSRLLDPADVALGASEYARTGGVLAAAEVPHANNYRARWTGELQLVHRDRAAERIEGLTIEMDWNPYCPPARLAFESKGARFEVPLHTVDLWTPMKRVWPGFDGTPLLLLGTLVLDDAVLTDVRPQVRRVVEHLRWYHHALFGFVVAMQGDRVEIRAIDGGPGSEHPIALFFRRAGEWNPPDGVSMPSGSVSALTGDLEALVRAPELVVDPVSSSTEALRSALSENVRLRDELRSAIKEHESRLSSIESFRSSIKFAAPLLPVGRVRALPMLLSLQSAHGQPVLIDAKDAWQKVDALLSARIAEYEDALKRRQE